MHLGHLLIFTVTDVNGHIGDHAAPHALVAEDVHTPAASRGHIGSPHAVYINKTFIRNVLHHVADLVRVRFEHDALAFLVRAQQRSPGGAVGVALHLVGELAHPLRPLALAADLKAGGAWGVKEIEKKGLSLAGE